MQIGSGQPALGQCTVAPPRRPTRLGLAFGRSDARRRYGGVSELLRVLPGGQALNRAP